MKFSMNGFRRQLHNDVDDLKRLVEQVLAGDFVEKEDLARAMNDVIRHSNVINCVYSNDDSDFSDMSDMDIDLIGEDE